MWGESKQTIAINIRISIMNTIQRKKEWERKLFYYWRRKKNDFFKKFFLYFVNKWCPTMCWFCHTWKLAPFKNPCVNAIIERMKKKEREKICKIPKISCFVNSNRECQTSNQFPNVRSASQCTMTSFMNTWII